MSSKNDTKRKKIYIACGGSAGHIFPGLALAEELIRRYRDEVKISFLTSDNRLGKTLLEESGYDFHALPRSLFKSSLKSMKIIFQDRPDCFIGFGSYVAGPPFVAASLLKVPTLIHEQNLVMGKANRIMRHFATKVALSFPEKTVPGKNIVITGNPTRESIARTENKMDAVDFLEMDRSKFTILIIGGSQGSRTVNSAAIDTFRNMERELRKKIQIIHISGDNDYEWLKKEYKNIDILCRLYPFSGSMSTLYSAADIAISRAGASCIFELCSHKIPAVLIPYPYAGGHQLENAKFLLAKGAAAVIKEGELSEESLRSTIVKLMEGKGLRVSMSEKIGELASPGAAGRLANEVGALAELKNKIHFIGIGGIGMSAVARILNFKGYEISGSDEKESSITEDMRREGIICHIGHNEENLGNSDTVVYSSSIKDDNVELKSARKKGIAVMHRAEMLSRMIGNNKGIAVTGAHGKTTTTAILSLIFKKGGLEPTAAVGGELLNFQSNAINGEGDYFIYEADESDGSLLKYYPDFAVLLNIDREHFDYFKNMENALNIYQRFICNVKREGTIYYNYDDDRLKGLLRDYHGRSVSFGTKEGVNIRAADIKQSGLTMRFRCVIEGNYMPEEFTLSAPGRHNVINALAAIAVAHDMGIGMDIIKDALAFYKGTKRRFEIKNASGGIMLIEDYAHHPAEIEAVLKACKPLKRKLIVVFQPHRYTRTKDLFKEFIDCFGPADYVILTDIYAASEKAIEGVTTKRLLQEMKQSGFEKVEYLRKDAVSKRVKEIAGAGDIVLILGAGDINEVAGELTNL
jgi:UDP-N-acetylmuramate--alanine ligase